LERNPSEIGSNLFGSSGKRVPPKFFTRRREDAKKEKQKNSGREQGTGAFLCFDSFGSRCKPNARLADPEKRATSSLREVHR